MHNDKISLCWKWIFAGIIFTFLAGCTIYAVTDFTRDTAPLQGNQIIKKTYSKAPLSRRELGRLIELTVYNGKPEYYGDMVLDRQSKKHKCKPVIFSHRAHRQHFTCNVCHTQLEFSLSKGQTDITREDYLDGRYCGACHNGKVAFSTEFACDVCHRKVNPSKFNYPAYKETANLPTTKYGDQTDWVTAIEQGLIQPKTFLPEEYMLPSMPLPEHLQQPLNWTTAAPRIIVHFPHRKHMLWLDCSNCHPDLFSIKQTGTVAFDKESNLYGQFCGACHMTVAFPMNGCNRCHPHVKNYTGKKI